MIKHIVAWDFFDEDKINNLNRTKRLLEGLPALIPEIVDYEIGINITASEQAKDMILLSSFEDSDALQRYSAHPEHQRVVQSLREVSVKSVVVDFEV